MSTSAVSFGVDGTAACIAADFGTIACDQLPHDLCHSIFDGRDSYSEEEADFLNELLAKQEDAACPVHLFDDDGAESSGLQAAVSDQSTTFADWDTDGVVPNIAGATSQVSTLQVPVSSSPLMLQLDYSDVISTWETMSVDKKHPISQSSLQHFCPDQLTTLQPPCLYNPQPSLAIMDATMNPGLSSASMPSFPPPQRTSARSSFGSSLQSSAISHMSCMDHVTGMPVQHPACIPRTTAEKTASLERYREKKATRQSGSRKIRYQIRKTNADNRPRFKGCFVKPSKLAELQMEAALNGDSYFPSSPMISGGSSDSTFV